MQNVPVPIGMVPGNSPMHRLNPLAKFVWVVVYIAVAFSTRNLLVLYGMAAFAVLLVPFAQVGRAMGRAVLVLVPIGSSLVVLQALSPAAPKPWTAIAALGPFTVYQDGVYTGLSLLGRIVSVLLLTVLVVMTTHPGDLFASLAKLKVPYVLNFMLAMTLQLIPVLQREMGLVLSAQRSRGMRSSGFGAIVPSFVPVFVGAIERVQQLSISLESRGFGSVGAKTSYRQVSVRARDWVVGVVGVAAGIGGVVWLWSHDNLDMSRSLVFPTAVALPLVAVAAVTFVGFIGFAVALMVRR